MEYCSSLSPVRMCNLLLGGTLRSSTHVAWSMYSIRRKALFKISAGNRFDLPVVYSSNVCLSAKVLINVNYNVSRDSCQYLYKTNNKTRDTPILPQKNSESFLFLQIRIFNKVQ